MWLLWLAPVTISEARLSGIRTRMPAGGIGESRTFSLGADMQWGVRLKEDTQIRPGRRWIRTWDLLPWALSLFLLVFRGHAGAASPAPVAACD